MQFLKLAVRFGERVILEVECVGNVFNVGYGFGYQQFLIGNIGRAEFADDYVAKERGYCVNLISISILGCGVDYACHSVEYFGNFHFDGCRNEIFYMRFVVQVGYNVEYNVYY